MTIGGWIVFGFLSLMIVIYGTVIFLDADSPITKVFVFVLTGALVIALGMGLKWFFANTASGQRALVDQKADLENGLERTVTVYTANGDIIAQYSGKISIEGNDGGYVLFDYNGKRYVYYNCFVESIADTD